MVRNARFCVSPIPTKNPGSGSSKTIASSLCAVPRTMPPHPEWPMAVVELGVVDGAAIERPRAIVGGILDDLAAILARRDVADVDRVVLGAGAIGRPAEQAWSGECSAPPNPK